MPPNCLIDSLGAFFLSEINDYFYYPVYYAARNKDDLYTGLHFICCFIVMYFIVVKGWLVLKAFIA